MRQLSIQSAKNLCFVQAANLVARSISRSLARSLTGLRSLHFDLIELICLLKNDKHEPTRVQLQMEPQQMEKSTSTQPASEKIQSIAASHFFLADRDERMATATCPPARKRTEVSTKFLRSEINTSGGAYWSQAFTARIRPGRLTVAY